GRFLNGGSAPTPIRQRKAGNENRSCRGAYVPAALPPVGWLSSHRRNGVRFTSYWTWHRILPDAPEGPDRRSARPCALFRHGRLPRFNLPRHSQPAVQRGNNRPPCLLDGDDRVRYLQLPTQVLPATGCQLHAYVLMAKQTGPGFTSRRGPGPPRRVALPVPGHPVEHCSK